MRIIAGEFRGRRIKGPEGKRVRPTTDRLRESIFNVAIHRFEGNLQGLRVADVFSGTGAFGLEALSRGASEATFVENHPDAWRLLEQNAALLGVRDRVKILKADVRAVPAVPNPFDVIFMDPPYAQSLIEPALAALLKNNWIGKETLVVVEREEKEAFNLPPEADEVRVIQHGKRCAHFLFFKV